ncbi:MAG: caspase family protein [Bacteroidota bacterium]
MPSPTPTDSPSIYFLGIGVNIYHHKDIPSLRECENDVHKMSALLREKFACPEGNIEVLTGDNATRENIISTFQSHFSQLKKEDVALVYFSGHGSAESPPPEFIKTGIEIENGQIETTLPVDARTPVKEGEERLVKNIADKEWRWLIHQAQKGKENIHFTAIFDCCHSGSMLRLEDELVRLRRYKGPKEPRKIEEFIGGYASQYEATQEIKLPDVSFISISACSPYESAVEVGNEGGLFTQALTSVLRSPQFGTQMPPYHELMSMVRTSLSNNKYTEQVPQIGYEGKLSPLDQFLNVGEKRLVNLPSFIYLDKEWRIGLGAIHGAHYQDGVSVRIFEQDDLKTPIGEANLWEIEVEHTTVVVGEELLNKLDEKKIYLAEYAGRKVPYQLIIEEGGEVYAEAIQSALKKAEFIAYLAESPKAPYTLTLREKTFEIHKRTEENETLIYGMKTSMKHAVPWICTQLKRIAKWEQVNALTTPKRSKVDAEELDFIFTLYDYGGEDKKFMPSENNGGKFLTETGFIPSPPGYNGFDKGGKYFSFEVKNNTGRDLYYYLVHLNRHYGISQYFDNFSQSSPSGGRRLLYDSEDKNSVLGIGDNTKRVKNIFLLIASIIPLETPYLLEQEGFGKYLGKIERDDHRGEREEKAEVAKRDADGRVRAMRSSRASWTVKRIEVDIVHLGLD